MPTGFVLEVQVDGIEPGGEIVPVVGAGEVVEEAMLEEGVAEEEEGEEGEQEEGRGADSSKKETVLGDERCEPTPSAFFPLLLLSFFFIFYRQSRRQGC